MGERFLRARWGVAIGVLVLCAAFVGFLVVRVGQTVSTTKLLTIPSGSMLPTLEVGSIHRCDLTAYRSRLPKVGDVVAFNAPTIALKPRQDSAIFVARCVGVQGDIVEIRRDGLVLNGKEVEEPYVQHKPFADFRLVNYKRRIMPLLDDGRSNNSPLVATPFELHEPEDLTAKLEAVAVPEGHILVMGDNRAGAFDGRSWGPLQLSRVIGRIDDVKLEDRAP